MREGLDRRACRHDLLVEPSGGWLKSRLDDADHRGFDGGSNYPRISAKSQQSSEISDTLPCGGCSMA